MSKTLSLLRVPAAMLALASVILIPAYFVSANEEVRENQPCAPIDGSRYFPPRLHLGEVVEVDTDANTILVKSLRPKDEGEEEYAFVTYDEETSFNEDGEETDEQAISEGDMIRLKGTFNFESDEYLVEIDADHIALFDEELPPRPGHGRGRPEAQTE